MRQLGRHVYVRCLIVCALTVLSGVAMIGFFVHPQKTQAATVVKIMPLGDFNHRFPWLLACSALE